MNQRFTIKLLIVGAAALFALWLSLSRLFVLPEDLPYWMSAAAPQRCVAIFVLCMSLWFTNLIPPAATGLLAIALLPLLDVLPKDKAFHLFGNSAVFFMLGVFLLAAAMIATGLSKRVTLLVLQRFDKSPTHLAVGVTVSAAFLALWMPEHAVAAMIYPIIVEIVATLDLPKGAPYAKKLFLGLAWGAIIGGVGTFLGGARAPLALGLLHESYPDVRISFLGWMAASMPIVIAMTLVAMWMIRSRWPNEIDDVRAATRMLKQRVRRLGPMSRPERRLAVLGVVTILTWIIAGHRLGLAVIAMIAAVFLFLLRIVDWKGIQGYVNWGVLIMYGGAVALGAALTETKAMVWVANHVIGADVAPLLIVMIMAASAMLLTEGISNSAAVAVLLPIGFSLGDTAGVGPVMMTLAVTIPSGLAFLLPVSSPPNAISFSAGHYSIREAVQLGWPMSVAAIIVLFTVITVWWNLVLDLNNW